GRIIEQIGGGQFAIYDPTVGEVTYHREIEADGTVFKPISSEFINAGGLCLPDKLVEYNTEKQLDADIEAFLQKHLDLAPRDLKLSARYVRFSYLFDKVLELPYLRPIGPRGNGKSRFVMAVGGVCYRPIMVISPSAASLFRIVDKY